MTPEAFERWLEAYKASGRFKGMAQLARDLDCDRSYIYRYRKTGFPKRWALAFNALLHGLEPYGESQ